MNATSDLERVLEIFRQAAVGRAESVRQGDVVLYHFASYVRHGSPDQEVRTRPAIVTSVLPDNVHLGPARQSRKSVLNLHVLFEERDFITSAQQQMLESMGVRAFMRKLVPAAYSSSGQWMPPSDNTWTPKEV